MDMLFHCNNGRQERDIGQTTVPRNDHAELSSTIVRYKSEFEESGRSAQAPTICSPWWPTEYPSLANKSCSCMTGNVSWHLRSAHFFLIVSLRRFAFVMDRYCKNWECRLMSFQISRHLWFMCLVHVRACLGPRRQIPNVKCETARDRFWTIMNTSDRVSQRWHDNDYFNYSFKESESAMPRW